MHAACMKSNLYISRWSIFLQLEEKHIWEKVSFCKEMRECLVINHMPDAWLLQDKTFFPVCFSIVFFYFKIPPSRGWIQKMKESKIWRTGWVQTYYCFCLCTLKKSWSADFLSTSVYVTDIYRLDEGVDGSDMGLFLIGGHWLKILPQNPKEPAKCLYSVCIL